jgi:hypothetical protein
MIVGFGTEDGWSAELSATLGAFRSGRKDGPVSEGNHSYIDGISIIPMFWKGAGFPHCKPMG